MAKQKNVDATPARMTVEAFTRQFILKARGINSKTGEQFAGVNTVVSKFQGYNFNQWYRSYHSRGLLVEDAPESPIDATKALEAQGVVVLGRGRPTGAYMVLAADSYKNGERTRPSALDALTI